MKVVKQRDYPVWVCYPCGIRHGFKECGVATWHEDKCGVCGEVAAVTEPRDFGHLKNSWMEAYDRGVAITAYLDRVLAKEEKDRISPNKNMPTPVSEYRQLNDGELVMDGDEFWGMDKCWLPATEIGKKVTTYTHKMYRRPMNKKTVMNKQERIKKWTAKIDKIVGNYKQLSAACDVAHDAGCLDIDGQLHTAIWKSFDVLMDCVEQQQWLEWYIYDNDCGAAKMEAGFDEVLNTIKNSRDLAKLIVDGEDSYGK